VALTFCFFLPGDQSFTCFQDGSTRRIGFLEE